jgi:prophage maintenance system killer protein
MQPSNKSEMIIYQSEDNSTQIEVEFQGDTVWLTQQQMTDLFQRDRTVITKHINNIFKEGELSEQSNVQKMHFANSDKPVTLYNLDVIISVGYRVKSKRGTQFRQWATHLLREHLTKGYTINQQRFETNARELEVALQLIKKTAQRSELSADAGRGLVDIVTRYAKTFLWLQRYDEGLLTEPAQQLGGILFSLTEAREALKTLKADLITRGETTDLFARERGDGLDALLGNLEQSVFGEPAYPSIESKAAHLLYFVIKNHPFADGNKRSGAFLFVDFLHRNNRLFDVNNVPVINDVGLAALALLVAESDPSHKETMIRLIMNMLSTKN